MDTNRLSKYTPSFRYKLMQITYASHESIWVSLFFFKILIIVLFCCRTYLMIFFVHINYPKGQRKKKKKKKKCMLPPLRFQKEWNLKDQSPLFSEGEIIRMSKISVLVNMLFKKACKFDLGF
jgi:hypothetical protein